MSRAARKWSWLTGLAVVVGAVAVNPAVRADDEYAPGPRTVQVGPGNFKNETTRVLANEKVTFVLKDDLEPEHSYKHSIAFSHPPNPTAPSQYELDPADPKARSFTVTFDQPGEHTYRCTLHPHRGVVKVRSAVTTTVPVPPPTTAKAPAPTTTSTTARPAVTAPPSTSQRGVVPAASEATTTTTPTTPAKSLSAPTAAPVAPSSAVADSEADEAEAAEHDGVAFDEASHQDDRDGGASDLMLIIAIGLAAALLAGGGWAWYHRPSRYLSA